jgi:uncharacterized protein YqgV (UPF0045/DUF77 family)
MALFHVEVYDPIRISAYAPKTIRKQSIRLTAHAKRKLKSRGIQLQFPICKCTPIEYELDEQGNIIKTLLRAPYDDVYDICLVLKYDGTIITVYRVFKNFHHEKLNTTRYVQRGEYGTK